ncbi:MULTISPECIES: aminoglycoside phosphotransferase family protein [Streptacidiphilus]|uniref:Aminoglycoside phosphotransferase family protein n=1 Tax=Streptacidiphilus cavernicola TaxID=3342716 RepID=A0ABV6UFC9_9ACTN|nr:aminoglycoside phosphotransferase family protein [Streptacidiphilus jeojiense]
MPVQKMHADEADIDAALVGRLIRAQFPQWSDLPLSRVPSAGTDNALFRLGPDLAVRLPRLPHSAGQAEKEAHWLPRLAPHLPLAVPTPVAVGEPGAGYPWSWSICRWLDGETLTDSAFADPTAAAVALAEFITALRRIDPTDGPAAGRGTPLAPRDTPAREALTALRGRLPEDDLKTLGQVWEESLQAPSWQKPPVWLHGDLLPGNLLVQQGRLSAVIDFGTLGTGDPAVDLLPAWALFSGESRTAFRDAVDTDEATWSRGRGWALSIALIIMPYYWNTNPVLMAVARRIVGEVLAE